MRSRRRLLLDEVKLRATVGAYVIRCDTAVHYLHSVTRGRDRRDSADVGGGAACVNV